MRQGNIGVKEIRRIDVCLVRPSQNHAMVRGQFVRAFFVQM